MTPPKIVEVEEKPMPNQRGLPGPDGRPLSRVEACIQLGRKMAEALERHAAAGSPFRQLAAEVCVLAKGLTGLSGNDIEQRGAPLVETVRALWAYRWDFPEAARPFPMFEPALYAVQYLDRDASDPLGRSAGGEAALGMSEPQIDNPSAYISGRIDAALAFLIDASLLKAVRLAVDTAGEWISLARAAGFDNSFELAAIDRFSITDGFDVSGLEDTSPYQVERNTDKLQAMIELASFLKTARLS